MTPAPVRETALVTGGAGFVGSHLVDRLLDDGWEVSVVDNLRWGKRSNVDGRATFHQVDITSGGDLTAILERERPQVVFHLAAQISIVRSMEAPIEDTQINVVGTVNVLDACVRAGVEHFMFMSTGGALYGQPEQVPCDEDYMAAPLSVYGASKLAAERYVRLIAATAGVRYTILRPGNIYGPRQSGGSVISTFLRQMLAGELVTVFGDGMQERDYVYVDDVVEAMMLAVTRQESGEPHTFNLGTGVGTSVREVYEAIAQATGSGAPPEYAPAREGEVQRISLDASRAERHLGWRPRMSFEEGIARTVGA